MHPHYGSVSVKEQAFSPHIFDVLAQGDAPPSVTIRAASSDASIPQEILALLGCPVVTVGICLGAVSTFLIWIGASHFFDTCDQTLQIWLIGIGVSFFAAAVGSYFAVRDVIKSVKIKDHREISRSRRVLRGGFFLFAVAECVWFGLGCAWVYDSRSCYETAPTVYSTAWWVVTSSLGIAGCSLLLGLIAFACGYVGEGHMAVLEDENFADDEEYFSDLEEHHSANNNNNNNNNIGRRRIDFDENGNFDDLEDEENRKNFRARIIDSPEIGSSNGNISSVPKIPSPVHDRWKYHQQHFHPEQQEQDSNVLPEHHTV